MRTGVALASVFLAVVSSFAAADAAKFSYCSSGVSLYPTPQKDLVTISDITLDPAQITVGQSVRVNVTGATKFKAYDPIAAVSVTHEGVPYLNSVQAGICYLPNDSSEYEEAPQEEFDNISCPVPIGSFSYSVLSPRVPLIVPQGQYGLTINLSSEGSFLVCVQLNVTVISGAATGTR